MTSLLVSGQVLPILSESNPSSVVEYMRFVNNIPMLTEQEEVSLCRKFYLNGDTKSGNTLLLSHLRLVVKMAFNFKRYHSSVIDLIAEGNLGLMKALKKFSIEKGVRFSTYAVLWIKASIQDFILKSRSIVRIGTTAIQRKILFNLSKVKKALKIYDSESFSKNLNNVAKALDVDQSDLEEVTSRMAPDISLNTLASEDGTSEYIDFISDDKNLEEEIIKSSLDTNISAALSKLTEREREIITSRIMTNEPLTLLELSKKFSVSQERIRQIETVALKKLKLALSGYGS